MSVAASDVPSVMRDFSAHDGNTLGRDYDLNSTDLENYCSGMNNLDI